MAEKRKYADRRKSIIAAVSKRRKKIKQMAIDYKGGQCSLCGYDKCPDALEFHHEGSKDFGLAASGLTRSWDKTRQELEKCTLVCSNCHREIHSQPQIEISE